MKEKMLSNRKKKWIIPLQMTSCFPVRHFCLALGTLAGFFLLSGNASAALDCDIWGGSASCIPITSPTSGMLSSWKATTKTGKAAIYNTSAISAGANSKCTYTALSYGTSRIIEVKITTASGKIDLQTVITLPATSSWASVQASYVVPASYGENVTVVMYESLAAVGEFSVANGAKTACSTPTKIITPPPSQTAPPEDTAPVEEPVDEHVKEAVDESGAEPVKEIQEETDLPDRNIYTTVKETLTTVFWVGETASEDNGFIHNQASAWNGNWEQSFGGFDNPDNRCGYRPCSFIPKENPFYVAIPYNDLTAKGERKASTLSIPWFQEYSTLTSVIKNRWVRVRHQGNTCYAQIEDVGPYLADDYNYTFGVQPSANQFGLKAGLDVSPAMRDCLQMPLSAVTEWNFVRDEDVPPGPWTQTVTTSGVNW